MWARQIVCRPHHADLTVFDYFTPSDQATRCTPPNDIDFGSGGVVVLPPFFHDQGGNLLNLLVLAEKESKLFFLNRDSLGQYGSSDNVVQEIPTPSPLEPGQEYLSTPAYWEWTNNGVTTRAIYYSAGVDRAVGVRPLPLNMYQLATSGSPISGTPNVGTSTLFCGHGTIPSVSSSGATPGTGIVWAIEDSNLTNVPPTPDCSGPFGAAVLHAYDAATMGEKYKSNLLTSVGLPTTFATSTVFKGRVYVGTRSEVDVFGLCGGLSQPVCLP